MRALSLSDLLTPALLQPIRVHDRSPIDPAIHAAVRQPRLTEESSQRLLWSANPAIAITFHAVLGGKGFDVRDAASQSSHRGQSAPKLGIFDVLDDIGAHDE